MTESTAAVVPGDRPERETDGERDRDGDDTDEQRDARRDQGA